MPDNGFESSGGVAGVGDWLISRLDIYLFSTASCFDNYLDSWLQIRTQPTRLPGFGYRQALGCFSPRVISTNKFVGYIYYIEITTHSLHLV